MKRSFFNALLKLVRVWNLLIIGLAQYFIAGFLVSVDTLVDWRLFLLALSTMIIAAGGYIINDYYDVKIDLINKPERVVIGQEISRRFALLSHSALSFAGVVMGFVLDWRIGIVNTLCASLLWL